jgi:hypothetical protein
MDKSSFQIRMIHKRNDRPDRQCGRCRIRAVATAAAAPNPTAIPAPAKVVTEAFVAVVGLPYTATKSMFLLSSMAMFSDSYDCILLQTNFCLRLSLDRDMDQKQADY